MVLSGILLYSSLLLAPPQDFLADGMKALDAGESAGAESFFRQAIAAGPGDYLAHFNLALALGMQQKDAEAVAEYRKCLELQPGLYEADLNLGTILLRDKKAAEALPVLQEAVKIKPDQARPNLYYAQALLETGDFTGAANSFGVVVKEADPKYAPAAELGLGQALLRDQKPDEAAVHLRKTAALDARNHESLLELAAAYEKSRQFQAAIAIYREFPVNAAAKQRIAQLEKPNYLALADEYTQNKQPAKAIEQLRLAVASDPPNFDLRMDLGRALRDQHEYGAASVQFREAAKLRPDSLAVWNDLAAVLVISKNFPEALDALDHARALGTETPGQLYFRAISLDSLKQHKPAIEAYQRFLASDGGKMPDEEFLARQRIRIIESEMKR